MNDYERKYLNKPTHYLELHRLLESTTIKKFAFRVSIYDLSISLGEGHEKFLGKLSARLPPRDVMGKNGAPINTTRDRNLHVSTKTPASIL